MKSICCLFLLILSWGCHGQTLEEESIALAFKTQVSVINDRFDAHISTILSQVVFQHTPTSLAEQLENVFSTTQRTEEQQTKMLRVLNRSKGVGAYRFTYGTQIVCVVHVPTTYNMQKYPPTFNSSVQYLSFLVAHELYHCAHSDRRTSEPIEEALADAYAALALFPTHPDLWDRITTFRRQRPHDLMHRSDELLHGWTPVSLKESEWKETFQALEIQICRGFSWSCEHP
jgi:hypothetical protein